MTENDWEREWYRVVLSKIVSKSAVNESDSEWCGGYWARMKRYWMRKWVNVTLRGTVLPIKFLGWSNHSRLQFSTSIGSSSAPWSKPFWIVDIVAGSNVERKSLPTFLLLLSGVSSLSVTPTLRDIVLSLNGDEIMLLRPIRFVAKGWIHQVNWQIDELGYDLL